MSPVFKAIATASILAFLMIVLNYPQYVIYGYGLIGLGAISVLISSLIEQNSSRQRQLDQQQFFDKYHDEFQVAIDNLKMEISVIAKHKTEQDKEIWSKLVSTAKQLDNYTTQVSDILESKLTDLTQKLNDINYRQADDSIEQQRQFSRELATIAEELSQQLVQENKSGRKSLDRYLMQITEKFVPIFDLVNQIKEQIKENDNYMQEHGHLLETGNKQLQEILSDHIQQFTKKISDQFAEFNEEFEDNLHNMSDNNRRQLDDIQSLTKTMQNGQRRTLEELLTEIQLMLESQKVTQAVTDRTLQELVEFKEELTQLNQKDLKLLEAMLNG